MADIDVGQISEALNTKVDLPDDKSQSDVKQIIETYVNGTSGYRIWSDGFCEQWGVINGSTITFLKTFTDTNYTVATCSTSNSTSSGTATYNDLSYYSNATYSKTTTSIVIRGGGFWKASGYLADGQY